jgi:hypothetical protein
MTAKHGYGICVTDLRWYCDQGGGAYGAEPDSPAFVVRGAGPFFCANKRNTALPVSVNSRDDTRRQAMCAKPIISWHSLERLSRTRLAAADKGTWEFRRPPNKELVTTEQRERPTQAKTEHSCLLTCCMGAACKVEERTVCSRH